MNKLEKIEEKKGISIKMQTTYTKWQMQMLEIILFF